MGFKSWLRKKLVGYDFEEFIVTQINLTHQLCSQIATFQEEQQKIRELILILAKQVPSEGWVPIIQNAIMSLDNRMESMGRVVNHHQKHFEDMIEEHEDLIDLALSKEKEDSN